MRQTWLDDIRCWSSPHETDDGTSLLVAVLEPFGRIGMPMGRESSLRMPLLDFNRLREKLSGSAFSDASGLVQALRMVKSSAEIEIIANICGIASRSFARAVKRWMRIPSERLLQKRIPSSTCANVLRERP